MYSYGQIKRLSQPMTWCKTRSHYELFEDTQVIEIIAGSMSTEAFHGYCLGNVLKYRLRAGNKDVTTQEIGKADKYKELYEDFKHLCK